MSFHKDIHDYLSNKLNSNSLELTFNLFHRYEIGETEFASLILESSYTSPENDESEDNVVVKYNGVEYNTPHGVYEIRNVQYIPCIIEDFIGDFEPIREFKNANYSIPITLFVDEAFNKANNNIVDNMLEEFQDSIRGLTQSLNGNKILFNHSDVRPISGTVPINNILYRSYQIIVYVETLSVGYFGNEILYWLKSETVGGSYTSLTQIYPVIRGSQRGNETVPIQKFKTELNNEIETRSVPNISAFGLSLSFMYEGGELARHFITQRYTPDPTVKYQIKIVYPGIVNTPFIDDYIIEDVGGPESLGEKLIINVSLNRASDVI